MNIYSSVNHPIIISLRFI